MRPFTTHSSFPCHKNATLIARFPNSSTKSNPRKTLNLAAWPVHHPTRAFAVYRQRFPCKFPDIPPTNRIQFAEKPRQLWGFTELSPRETKQFPAFFPVNREFGKEGFAASPTYARCGCLDLIWTWEWAPTRSPERIGSRTLLLMLRWSTVLPTSPQGTKANELGAEVLFAISREFGKSLEWLLTGEG